MFCSDPVCNACYHFTVILESSGADSRNIPSTYDATLRTYVWKFEDVAGYLLVPRTVDEKKATIDLYLCIEERDRETIDAAGYAKRFIENMLIRQNRIVSLCTLEGPEFATPDFIPCRRPHYQMTENIS